MACEETVFAPLPSVGGIAALWYSCPDSSVDTPAEDSALNGTFLTPIMDSYPESKRNGVGLSDKIPDWFGGTVMDDCQLRYGGPDTSATWVAEKLPNGSASSPEQKALLIAIEYQLPGDFECPNAPSRGCGTPLTCAFPRSSLRRGPRTTFGNSATRIFEVSKVLAPQTIKMRFATIAWMPRCPQSALIPHQLRRPCQHPHQFLRVSAKERLHTICDRVFEHVFCISDVPSLRMWSSPHHFLSIRCGFQPTCGQAELRGRVVSCLCLCLCG